MEKAIDLHSLIDPFINVISKGQLLPPLVDSPLQMIISFKYESMRPVGTFFPACHDAASHHGIYAS